MKNSILLLVVIGVAGSMLSCTIHTITTFAKFHGNEQEMAAYDEVSFERNNKRLADNPSEQAQGYYYAGDVLIEPPSAIGIIENRELTGGGWHNSDIKIGINVNMAYRMMVYSYRSQQIVIRNARIVYDRTGLELPIQEPRKDDVIHVRLQYQRDGGQENKYFFNGSSNFVWRGTINAPCDYEVCIDSMSGDFLMHKKDIYRLRFEVEFEEEGVSKTKQFEYKYKFLGEKELSRLP